MKPKSRIRQKKMTTKARKERVTGELRRCCGAGKVGQGLRLLAAQSQDQRLDPNTCETNKPGPPGLTLHMHAHVHMC